MRKCDKCKVSVKGDWEVCPLCQTPLDVSKPVEISSLPDIPLRYHRQRLTRLLIAISLLIIFTTFILGYWWRGSIEVLEAGLFGVMTMWLVVITIIRKRRNLAKSLLYLLVILALVCVYLDYLAGWTGWSTTYAIPIICCTTVVSMFIVTRITRMKPGDYVLYLTTADLIGLVPIVFLLFDWVNYSLPSWISIGISFVMLVLMFIVRRAVVWNELKKRLFI